MGGGLHHAFAAMARVGASNTGHVWPARFGAFERPLGETVNNLGGCPQIDSWTLRQAVMRIKHVFAGLVIKLQCAEGKESLPVHKATEAFEFLNLIHRGPKIIKLGRTRQDTRDGGVLEECDEVIKHSVAGQRSPEVVTKFHPPVFLCYQIGCWPGGLYIGWPGQADIFTGSWLRQVGARIIHNIGGHSDPKRGRSDEEGQLHG